MKKLTIIIALMILALTIGIRTSQIQALETSTAVNNTLAYNYAYESGAYDGIAYWEIEYRIACIGANDALGYITYFKEWNANHNSKIANIKFDGYDPNYPGEEYSEHHWFKDISHITGADFYIIFDVYEYVYTLLEAKAYITTYILGHDLQFANTNLIGLADSIVLENGYNYTAGYDTGYALGFTAGANATFSDGYEQGTEDTYPSAYASGYDDGVQESWSAVYTDGYTQGHLVGKEENDNDAYTLGYETGLSTGYSNGYGVGVLEVMDESLNIGTFIQIAADGIGGLLAVELLPNISLGMIVAVPLIFGLIAFVVGVSSGRKGSK